MKKREHKIAIRMTPEEFASLKQRAKEFDGNVSEYVRNCILAGETSTNSVPKTKILWFVQQILADPELRKNKKLTKIVEEVFSQWL